MPFLTSQAADSLAAPSVTLPSGWESYVQVSYPSFSSGAHDPQGCGLTSYNGSKAYENATAEVTIWNAVLIFYEESMGTSYSGAQLQAEAQSIAPGPYQYYQYSQTAFGSSGVSTYADVSAGYAIAYNTTYGYYLLHVVMVKGDYYLDILSSYVNPTGQAEVDSVINSISVPEPTPTPTSTTTPTPTQTSPTPTATSTPTPAPTSTPTPGSTATPTPTGTTTPTPTSTSSPSPSATPTSTPSPSGTASPTPTSPSTSPTPASSPSPSPSPGQPDATSTNTSQFLATPWVPPSPNAVAATAVTVVAVSASSVAVAAAVTPVGVPTGRVTQEIKELLPSSVKKWLTKYMSSKSKSAVAERMGSPFMPQKSEAITYCISIAILAFAFSYVKANNLAEILAVLPTVLATSIIVEIAKTYLLIAYARSRGVWTEHKLWYFGLATFVIATLAFKVPFSSPSRSVHYAPKLTQRLGAILASAAIFIALAFAGFFYVLLLSGFTAVGSTGLAMCIIGAFFDTFPIAPMSGKVIFNYKKSLWLGLFTATLTLYIAWLLLV